VALSERLHLHLHNKTGDQTMYDTVTTATLVRWLSLDLPADVLAEIDAELNTRKE
jgi:hypothetical protein